MDGEPLMDSEGIGEVRAALAALPGLAGVAVIEHDAGPAGRCPIAYVASSDPGLDVPELHAYARKALLNGSMPAAIVVLDEIPVTAAGAVDLGGRSIEAMVLAGRISTALGIRISMADLFKASAVGDMDRRLDLMADARK